jgi:hypothetical protein
MRSAITLVLATAMAVAPLPGGAAAADPVPAAKTSQVEPRGEYVPYKLIYKPELEYPQGAGEALLYVRFLISAEGLPEQIEVDAQRGFYKEVFKTAVLGYVQALRFEPARFNGVAVEAGPVVQPFNFSIAANGQPAFQVITDEFRRELDKVENLLRKRDYPGAHFHAEWMLREKVQFKYEYAVLQAQLAQTHATVGNLDEAMRAASAATSRTVAEPAGYKLRQPVPRNDASHYLLPRELILYLLELRMRLHAQRGDVLAALKTYNELAGLKKFKPKDPPAILAEQLVTLLESGRPLATRGVVTGEFWSHEQFHPTFTVRNVQGKVNLYHVHCRGQYLEHPYKEDAVWSIPAGAEACVVEVYADPGTTFEFIELPVLTAAAMASPG